MHLTRTHPALSFDRNSKGPRTDLGITRSQPLFIAHSLEYGSLALNSPFGKRSMGPHCLSAQL
jgi:hypothetical protein